MPASLGPSRWKRLLYSALSVLLVVLLVVLLFTSSMLGNGSFSFEEALFFGFWTLLSSLPGWLIALSFVLTVTNYSRWRFLAFWAIGTAVGPFAILATSYVTLVADTHRLGISAPPSFWPGPGLTAFATIVASLVTLIYLLLVRYDQRRARRREANNAGQPDPTPQTS